MSQDQFGRFRAVLAAVDGGLGAPLGGRRGYGMTGETAQGIEPQIGPAERQVGDSPIEKETAAVAVMFHGSHGIGSSGWRLWRFGEAGFRTVVSTRPGDATICPTFSCTRDLMSSLRAGARMIPVEQRAKRVISRSGRPRIAPWADCDFSLRLSQIVRIRIYGIL